MRKVKGNDRLPQGALRHARDLCATLRTMTDSGIEREVIDTTLPKQLEIVPIDINKFMEKLGFNSGQTGPTAKPSDQGPSVPSKALETGDVSRGDCCG